VDTPCHTGLVSFSRAFDQFLRFRDAFHGADDNLQMIFQIIEGQHVEELFDMFSLEGLKSASRLTKVQQEYLKIHMQSYRSESPSKQQRYWLQRFQGLQGRMAWGI
jgi:hypothetical protein